MKATGKNLKSIPFLMFLIFVSLPSVSSAASASGSEYCVIPPYVGASVKPNLLFMIDNSASQFDLQYIAGTSGAPVPTYTCQGSGGAGSD